MKIGVDRSGYATVCFTEREFAHLGSPMRALVYLDDTSQERFAVIEATPHGGGKFGRRTDSGHPYHIQLKASLAPFATEVVECTLAEGRKLIARRPTLRRVVRARRGSAARKDAVPLVRAEPVSLPTAPVEHIRAAVRTLNEFKAANRAAVEFSVTEEGGLRVVFLLEFD